MNKQIHNNRLIKEHAEKKLSIKAKQQGVVLIWAVVFLLIITIIGLSAIRMSGIDTQISGNSVNSMLTYQGVESALGKTVMDTNKVLNITMADANYPNKYDVVVADFFPPEEVSGGGLLTSVASIQIEDVNIACPMSLAATSTNLGCNVFRIDATTRLQGTGAKASHTIGLADHAPRIYK